MIKHFRCGKKACVVHAIQDVMLLDFVVVVVFFIYVALISKDVFFLSATKISQDLNPDCQLSWYASVYCSCLERHSRLFLWTSERRRKCVLIAEKKRHKEGGRMKRRVDSWSPSVSLKGGDSEQQ